MLLPYLEALNSKKIILGSQSKSRNQLVGAQKLKYQRISSTYPEDLDKTSFPSPAEYNLQTCRGKVKELTGRFQHKHIPWDILICGDTIVYHEGQIIEKPEDQKHCIEMMGGLAGKTHNIYTANIITFNSDPVIKYEWVSKADVTFGEVPLASLQAFAKTDEPYIHSGGYELAAVSASFIKEVKGSHTAIQGLDMHQVCSNIILGAKQLKWIQ